MDVETQLYSQGEDSTNNRETDLLRALNAAAASLQRSVRSETKVLQAFNEQILQLNLFGTVNLLDETGQNLVIRALSQPPVLERYEQFKDIKAIGFTFPWIKVAVYRKVIETGETVFAPDCRPILAEVIPNSAQLLLDAFQQAYGGKPAIFAPIKSESGVRGVFDLVSADLTPRDIPAAEAFANHIAIALDNARLFTTIQQKETQYRRLFESAMDGILILNPDATRILSTNSRFAQITGYSQEELLEMRLEMLFPADEAQKGQQVLKTLYEKGNAVFEFPLRRKDGQNRLLQISATHYEANGGQLIQGLVRDVTEDKRAEQALQENEQKFHDIVRESTDGIVLADESGNIIEWNRGQEQITGLSREDVLGQPLWDVQIGLGLKRRNRPGASKELKQEILAALRSGEAPWMNQVSEIEIQKPDGTLRIIQVRIFPIKTEKGYMAGSIIRDVSELKQMEKALRRRTEELTALHTVTLNITAAQELPVLLQNVIEQAIQLLNATGGGLLLRQPDGQEIHPAISHGESLTNQKALKYSEDLAAKVAQTGEPMLVEDYRTWPERRAESGKNPPFLALLAAPMIWQDRVTGVVHVFMDDDSRHFTQTDLELLTLFASQASIAIENARLFEAEKSAREQAETLIEVAQAVSRSLDIKKVLRLILIQLKRVLTFDTTSVLLLGDENQPTLVASIGYEDEELTSREAARLLADSPILRQMAENLRPLCIPDVHQYPGWIWVTGAEHVRSFLGVPIISRQKMIGAVMVDSVQINFFDEANIRTVQSLAQHMSIAIENARLYEAEGKRAAELEAVRQASLSLTASLELHQVLDAILHSALNLLPEANNSHIFLYNPANGGKLTFGAALYAKEPQPKPWSEPRPNGLTYTVARSGEPIAVPDMQNHPLYKDAPDDWVGAIVGLPLRIGQRVVGVMNISYRQPRQFPEAELRLLRLLGDQAAIAIENARLFEQAATERRHLSLLYDASRELSASLDTDEILNRAVILTCQSLNALMGRAFLYLPEENRLALSALYGQDGISIHELDAKLDLHPGKGLVGWVAEHRKPANVTDIRQDPRWLETPGVDEQARAAITAPIIAGDRLLGVLIVLHHQPAAFTDDHLALMQAICQELGLALSNASRYQQVERRLNEITLIQSLAQAFNQRLEVLVLLDEVATQLAQKLDYSQVRIFLVENDSLVLKACFGTRPPRDVYSLDEGVIGKVARTGQVIYVADVTQDADYQACIQETVSELAVPICRGSVVVGVINIESERSDQLSAQDRDLLQVLAGQISVALENAVLYEHVRRHAEDLERIVAQRTAELMELYELSQEIGYRLSYEELLRLLLRHLRTAIGSEMVVGCLMTNDCRSLFIETSRPLAPAVVQDVRSRWLDIFKSNSNLAAGMKQVPIETIAAENFTGESPPIQQVASLIQAPIIVEKKTVGTLIAAGEQENAFGEEQERLLTTFANQAATAVQRLASVLSAQQKHLESLVEHVPVGILLFDSEFNLLVANPLGREILSTLETDGNAGPEIRLGTVTLQELIAHQPDFLPVELTLDGPPRRVFATQTRQIGDGKPQWVLTIREITQERENQERIQSQERLATVGQLAAGIAHDFNNIMAAILVYADLLRQDLKIPSDSREKLTIIQQQVQRAASLIRQILDFSRRSVMEQSALNLLPFVKELDKMLGRVMPETIRLELTYQPGVYQVNADPTRLQQVFMNLALNARDAMPEGGLLRFDLGRLSLGPEDTRPIPEMPAGEWVRISVKDTGIGIPADVQPHIFDPFFTTKPVGQGTGLGLAQVYGIIKQHDGFIDVKSQPGEGATFILYLPALKISSRGEPQAELPGQFNGDGETVLVVEDNEATREALRALLEAHQYKVIPASNGVEALNHFEQVQGSVSLVVSDVVMPQMGGLALYRALYERKPGIKMLFITGHPMELDSQSFLEIGSVHWLQKPFSIMEFKQAVRSLMQKERKPR